MLLFIAVGFEFFCLIVALFAHYAVVGCCIFLLQCTILLWWRCFVVHCPLFCYKPVDFCIIVPFCSCSYLSDGCFCLACTCHSQIVPSSAITMAFSVGHYYFGRTIVLQVHSNCGVGVCFPTLFWALLLL